MYHNLQVLASRHRIALVSFIEHETERQILKPLEDMGIEVTAVRRRPEPERNLWVPRPREHAEFSSPELNAIVRYKASRQQFDVIQVEFLQMAQHVPPDSRALKVLTEHEVMFETFRNTLTQETRPWRRPRGFYDWLVQLNYEVRVCRRFDRIACMTDEDREILGRFVSPGLLQTVPIGVDCSYFDSSRVPEGTERPFQMLFVGNYRHPPNGDAVYFFASEILPRVLEQIPEAEFYVVGGNADALDRKRLGPSKAVRIVGYVDDIRTAYRNAAVFVAPIRTGTGMRVKLLEALSMGTAVVATPLAAQGFRADGEEALLVADNPQSFAQQTVGALQDAGLRKALGVRARRMILERYDWQVVEEKFLNLVENLHG